MGLNLICSRQRFVAFALIIGIGLSAYGCADTASINPVGQLASLTVTPGTLQPTFTGGTTQYTVDLTSDVTSVRVTAQPAVAGDKVTINGQTTTSSAIALGPEGSTTSVSIVVSESSNSSRTYIVLLKRASLSGNNSLQRLDVLPGTLTPAFNANTQNYSVDVANNVETVSVTPFLQDSAATMTVDGQATNSGETRTIQLGGTGSSTPIDIVVKAQNGNQKTYRVTVNRGKSGNNFLQSLGISPGTLDPSFSAGTEGYTVNLPSILPNNVISTVKPTLQDLTASMSISVNNGQPTNIHSGETRSTPLPVPGSTTFIAIVVTAQNGSQKTYTVNVVRAALSGNNNLSALTVRVDTVAQTLSPTFSPSSTDYTMNVGSTVTSVTVTATPQEAGATLKLLVNGVETTSSSIPLTDGPSSTEIGILVTAPNSNQKTYLITVNRAAPSSDDTLAALTVTANNAVQSLAPDFNVNILDYTINVANTDDQVTVAATKSDLNAVMLIGSVSVPAGAASGQETFPLSGPGTQTVVSISVTAQSGGAPKTYTITVNRAASNDNHLSALTVAASVLLDLSPPFDRNHLDYTVEAPIGTIEVTVTATKSDPNATMMINGQGTSLGQATILFILLPPPQISITVTAPDGSFKTYTVTVNQAPVIPPSP